MDKYIFFKLYNFTMKHKIAYSIVEFIVRASSCVFFILFGICSVGLAFLRDERFFKFVFVVCFGIAFNMILRKIIGRTRPFDEFKIESVVWHKSGGSFPSNHSASAMIIAMAFFYLNEIFGAIVFLLAVVTGVSRVFAGLHYPSDVICGFLVGTLLGYFGFFLL